MEVLQHLQGKQSWAGARARTVAGARAEVLGTELDYTRNVGVRVYIIEVVVVAMWPVFWLLG